MSPAGTGRSRPFPEIRAAVMPRDQRASASAWRAPAEIRFGPNGIRTVPSGLRVKQARVILDGAADIGESRDWLATARPVVPLPDPDGTRFTYGDVRDVTAIVRVQRD